MVDGGEILCGYEKWALALMNHTGFSKGGRLEGGTRAGAKCLLVEFEDESIHREVV